MTEETDTLVLLGKMVLVKTSTRKALTLDMFKSEDMVERPDRRLEPRMQRFREGSDDVTTSTYLSWISCLAHMSFNILQAFSVCLVAPEETIMETRMDWT